MAIIYDLRTINLTRRMFEDPVFVRNLRFSLQDTVIKAIKRNFYDEAELIANGSNELKS